MPDKLLEELCSLLQMLQDFQDIPSLSPTQQGFIRNSHATYVQAKEKLINDMAASAMDPYPGTSMHPALDAVYKAKLQKNMQLTRSTIQVYFQ
jgi:hypothetical protein